MSASTLLVIADPSAPFLKALSRIPNGVRAIISDDPTKTEWQGRPLFGHYTVDVDGVPPKPLSLVEKGVLKNFLLTRHVKEYVLTMLALEHPGDSVVQLS